MSEGHGGPIDRSGSELEDERKREALRKAGQEYFERVLAEASTGKDPFAPEPISQKPVSRSGRDKRHQGRRQRPQKEDPDLEAVGAIITGARLYILTALFVGCTGVGFVFMKASLNPLETPGILTFLHLCPVTFLLLAFSGSLELDPVSIEGAKASLPTAIPRMLQAMMIFSSLLHGSVLSVLCFTMAVGELLQATLEGAILRTAASGRRKFLCSLGIMGLGAVLLCEVTVLKRKLPPLRSMLALLGWVVAKGLEIAWSLLKRSPERAHEMLGPFAATTIASLADSEDDLMPGTLLLYQHMVPAVPALIIGFCGLEGNELVEHELSVPAVTAIIMSVCCFVGATISGLLLEPQLTGRLRSGLLGLAAFVTMAFDAVGMNTNLSVVSLAGAVLACTSSTLVHFLP